MPNVTNDEYWNSQPEAVQALKALPIDSDQRFTLATQLAQMGYKIDYPIMIWGWDAYVTMYWRVHYGDKWAPSFLQPTPLDINDCKDLTKMPPGAISTISTDESAYPQPQPPTPPSDPNTGSPGDWVGIPTGKGFYAAKESAMSLSAGFKATPQNCTSDPCKRDGLTLVFQKFSTPFGVQAWFEVVQ